MLLKSSSFRIFAEIIKQMNNNVAYWFEMSDYDFDTAVAMYENQTLSLRRFHVSSGY